MRIIKKTPNTAQLQKRIASQQATIEQKDKTIQQLKKQLANTPATETSIANEQAALNNKIKELQVALTAATAKNEALIKKKAQPRILFCSKVRPPRCSRSNN
jgi:septal ring factor EnvC (AmiA/AmiB activator)